MSQPQYHPPTEIVHLEYNPETLPPLPSDEWTRFVCISDTHSRTFDVPDGDSGDLTNTGTVQDFKRGRIIAGNHDLSLHIPWYETGYDEWHWKIGKQDINVIMEMLKGPQAAEAGIVYLQDEKCEFRIKENGKLWTVYGSPWTPEFCNWASTTNEKTEKNLYLNFLKPTSC